MFCLVGAICLGLMDNWHWFVIWAVAMYVLPKYLEACIDATFSIMRAGAARRQAQEAALAKKQSAQAAPDPPNAPPAKNTWTQWH